MVHLTWKQTEETPDSKYATSKLHARGPRRVVAANGIMPCPTNKLNPLFDTLPVLMFGGTSKELCRKMALGEVCVSLP